MRKPPLLILPWILSTLVIGIATPSMAQDTNPTDHRANEAPQKQTVKQAAEGVSADGTSMLETGKKINKPTKTNNSTKLTSTTSPNEAATTKQLKNTNKINRIRVEGQGEPKSTEKRLPTVEEHVSKALEGDATPSSQYKGSTRTECQANCKGPACCLTSEPEKPSYLSPSITR